MGFYAWAVRDGDVKPFCQGNFDFDDDVDGSDAHTFKQHFGRSVFKNPCPPDGPAPVQRTGQTAETFPRDDGFFRKGVHWPNPRFADNGDGTVTDNLTGLIWLKNANCFGPRWWVDAIADCNGLGNGQCGLTDGSNPEDWRLPNLFELQSLLDMRYWEPALSNSAGTGQWTHGDPFTNLLPNNYYWSSTTNAQYGPAFAWLLYVFDGHVEYDFKDISYYVWPVRGGH